MRGGVEIPCTLVFKEKPSRIEKLKGLLKECEDNSKKDRSTATNSHKDSIKEDRPGTGNEVPVININDQWPSIKKEKNGSESEWVCLGRMSLQVKDKDVIIQGEQLTDKYINASQKLRLQLQNFMCNNMHY